MKQSTIKDVRTTLIVLLVSILSSASAIYILPTVIAPVHAGFGSPAVTTTPASPTPGVGFTVTVNVPATPPGQFVTYICVYFYNPAGNQVKSTCSSKASTPAFSATTATSATSPGISWPSGAATGWSFRIEAGSSDPSSIRATASCTTSCSLGAASTVNLSPGSCQLLIHEYTSTDLEMQAFQAGSIDMVDWDIPQAYLSAWNNCASATPIGPNCNGQITTSKYSATDLYEMDLNENGSRVASQLGFRQAMGYLVDRQNIVLNIAGGFAQPVCSGASAGQEGSASCQSLGYPGPYGDYNPTKALQLLYESGWRFNPADGFLYGPALPGALGQAACSSTITGQTGNFCVRPIIFMIRSDDPLRLGAGQAMANIMQNLPNQFCTKAGGNINPIPPCPAGSTLTTVCPAAPCKLSTSLNVAAKPALAKIFQHHPWNTWDIYTGGWGLDILVANDLPFLWTSDFAPTPDCGLWEGDFPLNYGGFCNTAFDNAAHAVLNAPTISQADAAAVAAQQVAWG